MSEAEPELQGPGGQQRTPDEILGDYLLVGPDAGKTPHERRWWRREGIYLSDVCLAVHLTPDFGSPTPGELEQAREALFTYLRQVAHIAMEHDYLRPLACVLAVQEARPNTETITLLKHWAPAQDWHRGAFTLYVEVPDQPLGRGRESDACDCPADPPWTYKDRLADLLSPRAEGGKSQSPGTGRTRRRRQARYGPHRAGPARRGAGGSVAPVVHRGRGQPPRHRGALAAGSVTRPISRPGAARPSICLLSGPDRPAVRSGSEGQYPEGHLRAAPPGGRGLAQRGGR
jgi:hypothetical protein